jgi:nitroreductase
MNVFDAVDSRLSCRWFLDRPVDPKIVRELIEKSARAASGGNLQPWKIYALTGEPLDEIKRRAAAETENHDPRQIDGEYPIYPKPMGEPYQARRHEHGVQLYAALKIVRDDMDGRLIQYKRNFEFFNAPVGLFITIERRLGVAQWTDLGGYLATLMVLARGYGLDTCPQESWARICKTVGGFLKLPDDHMLFCGVALGYGDRAHPANSFRSHRARLEEYCTFLGFDAA